MPGLDFKKGKRTLNRTSKIILSLVLVSGVLAFFSFQYFFKDVVPVIRMVSGTEYISGEHGQVIVRLTDQADTSITDATCTATILYPDKSYFMIDGPMVRSTTPGNYYQTFMTPAVNGIYEEIITCTFVRDENPQIVKISSSFHVSVALNFIIDLSRREKEHYEALSKRINDTYFELLKQINSSSSNFENIDSSLKYHFGEMNHTLNNNFQGVKNQMNQSNEKLYSDMHNLGNAFVTIFGDE